MIKIGNDWDEVLKEEFQKDYFKSLEEFLKQEYSEHTIYPPAKDIFKAFELTSYNDTKVVILGQDPYHEPGQAQGLAFSVPKGTQYPPSLRNIFKELADDAGLCGKYEGIKPAFSEKKSSAESNIAAGAKNAGESSMVSASSSSDAAADAVIKNAGESSMVRASSASEAVADAAMGDTEGVLVPWAKQGVLLLNTALTVRAHEAASHKGKGWEIFTDEVISLLAAREKPLVFILWGAPAGRKKDLILKVQNGVKHLIITAPHPSPLSAHRGFFGGRYFSRCNYFLCDNGQEPIYWKL